jgi:hypothetical protein
LEWDGFVRAGFYPGELDLATTDFCFRYRLPELSSLWREHAKYSSHCLIANDLPADSLWCRSHLCIFDTPGKIKAELWLSCGTKPAYVNGYLARLKARGVLKPGQTPVAEPTSNEVAVMH